MPRWLPRLGRATPSPGSVFGAPPVREVKDAAMRRASQGRGYVYAAQAYVPPGPDVERIVRDGYEKVIWVFKAVDAIADKVSGWPIVVQEGRGDDAKDVEDRILPLLNEYANEIERSAKYFRYRLISQLLLSKRGVFVEVRVDRAGRAKTLNLLPPAYTSPLPDPDVFVAKFRVSIPGADGHIDLPVYEPGKGGVLWIRKPHPTDPYSSVTPLEAAGISIDLDFYARLYNRNFLVNDGRAGQIVAVKGHMSHEDAQELKTRFSPGMGGAGRTTVVEAEGIEVKDTAVSPRDAQYAELRNITKEDLLIALGTPESVLGKASGVTYDAADAELWNWLTVTCLPLSQVVESGLDPLTQGGWEDGRQVVHDVRKEPVLQRINEALLDKARADQASGRITLDEYRVLADLDPLKRPATKVLWIPGGKIAVGDEADEELAGAMKPAGAPAGAPAGGGPGGVPASDPFTDTTGNTSDGAVPIPQGEDLADGAFEDVTAGKALELDVSAGVELEAKRWSPDQPRYPKGHPKGGQFLDLGDTALWLAGRPFKDGTSSAGVVNPNVGSTATPAGVASGGGGSVSLVSHPDPKVRAAAVILSFPSGYPYPRVLGAPMATKVSLKPIKAVSLRKGDVVSVGGKNYAIAENRRTLGAKGAITFDLVADDGSTTTLQSAQQSTLTAVARTPHPTVTAAAKVEVAAAVRALRLSQAQATAVQPRVAAVIPGGVPRPGQVYSGPVGTLTVTSAGNGMLVNAGGQPPGRLMSAASMLRELQGPNGYQLQAAPVKAPAKPVGPFPKPPLSGSYSSLNTGAVLMVYTDGSGAIAYAGAPLTPQSPANVQRFLSTAQAGPTWQQDQAVSILNPMPAPAAPVAAAAAPTARAAAPVAAPVAATRSPLPAPFPGDLIYRHPQGKHIYVGTSGVVTVWKPDGKRGVSSATAAKLAAGHGAWTLVTAPDGWLASAGGGFTRDPNYSSAAAPAPVVRASPPPAPAVVPATVVPPVVSAAPVRTGAVQAVLNAGVVSRQVTGAWTLDAALPQSGSNPAAGMLDAGGKRFYVKSQDAQHADNEVAAARLYAATGTRVPQVARATVAAGSFAGQTGTDGIASEVLPITSDMSARMRRDPVFRDKVLEDFAVHAWMSNWDAVENNNTGTNAAGDPVTIDVGGSLLYRARGGARTLSASVGELQSMRTSGTAGATFAQLTPDGTDPRFVRGVERIAAISPADLRTILDESLPSHSAKARRELADVMIARRADLALAAGVTLPENRAGAVTVPAAAPVVTAPATAPAAAPSVPTGVIAGTVGAPVPAGIPAPGSGVVALYPSLPLATSPLQPGGAYARPSGRVLLIDASGTSGSLLGPGANLTLDSSDIAALNVTIANGSSNLAVLPVGPNAPGAVPVAPSPVAGLAAAIGAPFVGTVGPFTSSAPGTYTLSNASGSVTLIVAPDGTSVMSDSTGGAPTIHNASATATLLRIGGSPTTPPFTYASTSTAPSSVPAGATPAATSRPVGSVGPFTSVIAGVYTNPDGQLVVKPDGTGSVIDAQTGQVSPLGASMVAMLLRNNTALSAWTYTSTAFPGSLGPAPASGPGSTRYLSNPTPASPPIVAAAASPSSKLGGQSPQSILTPPPGYAYGVVVGAPVAATILSGPKSIKLTSLRKGDVVQYPGTSGTPTDVTIVSTSGGTITGVDVNGNSYSWTPVGDPIAVARTPHPTVVAAARRALSQQATPAAPAAGVTPNVPAGGSATSVASVGHGTAATARFSELSYRDDYVTGTYGPRGAPASGETYVDTYGNVLIVHADLSATRTDDAGVVLVVPRARVDAELTTGYRWSDPSIPTVAPGPNAQPMVKTVPAVLAGLSAGVRARNVTALSGGYRPVPGETYATPSGGVMVVHSDGSGDLQMAAGTAMVPMTAAQIEQTLQPGTGFVPVGPRQTTPMFSYQVGRHSSPVGDLVDVDVDGTGVLTTAAGVRTVLTEVDVDTLLSASVSGFSYESPSPAGPSAGQLASTLASQPAPTGPIPAPAGGWGASGQILPGAVFALPNGTTLTVGPRGGGKLQLGGQTATTNMSAVSMRSTLNRSAPSGQSPWLLQTGSPQAGLTPAPAPVTRAPAPASAPVGRSGAVTVATGGTLPPKGTPVLGSIRTGQPSHFPVAATGAVTATNGRDVVRGVTVRQGGEDFVVTEVIPVKGGGTRLWGYRPGKDDPLVITQDADGVWRQGVEMDPVPPRRGRRGQVDVVAATPALAANVPAGATARPYDATLGTSATTAGVGAGSYSLGFTVETQNVGADTLQPGDAILLNGRESEGLFVVDKVGVDSSGRQAVFGWAPGLDPARDPAQKLFLTNPGSAMRQSRVVVNGSPAKPADVPRPRAPMSTGGIVRNDISDPSSQAKLKAMLGNRYGLSHPSTTAAKGDVLAANLMELRGFNARPDVVDDADLDGFIRAGEIELWRGVKQDGTSNDYVEQYRSGKHYTGGLGGAQYGSGTYTAYGKNSGARSRSGSSSRPYDGIKFAMSYAGGGYTGTASPGSGNVNSALVRMTLKADARVAEFDALERKRQNETDYDVRNMDAGQYAVYLGYDAMRKSNAYAASVGVGKKDDWESGFVIVLNRSAVRVSSKTYVDDAYVRTAKPGADPPPKTWTEAHHIMKSKTAKHATSVDFHPTAA